MNLIFSGMPSDLAAAYRGGAPDANGQAAERRVSVGTGVPCRHCLHAVAKGDAYLVLAYRPFPAPQPYAELGPIFLHAEACPAYTPDQGVPERLRSGDDVILRGYDVDDRIVYGSGVVVPPEAVEVAAGAILAQEHVSYVHVRSSTNNCYALRIDRGRTSHAAML